MRAQFMFTMSILLVVVTAMAKQRDPRSWETYNIGPPYPPFSPPDIGPLYLPREYFRDYPDLTSPQIQRIREKSADLHRMHVRSFLFFVVNHLTLSYYEVTKILRYSSP